MTKRNKRAVQALSKALQEATKSVVEIPLYTQLQRICAPLYATKLPSKQQWFDQAISLEKKPRKLQQLLVNGEAEHRLTPKSLSG